MRQVASREIPYVQRTLPNILDAIIDARNSGNPDKYSMTVDTLEIFLTLERPFEITIVYQSFKDGEIREKYNGNGFFDSTYPEKETKLDQQFKKGEIKKAEWKIKLTDYRLKYMLYLLETGGLLTYERGDAFDVSGFD